MDWGKGPPSMRISRRPATLVVPGDTHLRSVGVRGGSYVAEWSFAVHEQAWPASLNLLSNRCLGQLAERMGVWLWDRCRRAM